MKLPRKFSYQGTRRTRFGFYAEASTQQHVIRHEFATRRERDSALKKLKG